MNKPAFRLIFCVIAAPCVMNLSSLAQEMENILAIRSDSEGMRTRPIAFDSTGKHFLSLEVDYFKTQLKKWEIPSGKVVFSKEYPNEPNDALLTDRFLLMSTWKRYEQPSLRGNSIEESQLTIVDYTKDKTIYSANVPAFRFKISDDQSVVAWVTYDKKQLSRYLEELEAREANKKDQPETLKRPKPSIKILQTATGKITSIGDIERLPLYMCLSPKGDRLFSLSPKPEVQIWDSKSGQLIKRLSDQTLNLSESLKSIIEMPFEVSPDSRKLAVGNAWYDLTADKLHPLDSPYQLGCFSKDSKSIVVSKWNLLAGKSVGVVEIETGKYKPFGPIYTAENFDQLPLDWNATGNTILGAYHSKTRTMIKPAFNTFQVYRLIEKN